MLDIGTRVLPFHPDFTEPFLDYKSINHLKSFSIPKHKGRRGTIFITEEGLNPIENKLLIAEEFCRCYAHFSSQLNVDKYGINRKIKQSSCPLIC